MFWKEKPRSRRFTCLLYLIFSGGVPSTVRTKLDNSPLHLWVWELLIDARGHDTTSASDLRIRTSRLDSSTTLWRRYIPGRRIGSRRSRCKSVPEPWFFLSAWRFICFSCFEDIVIVSLPPLVKSKRNNSIKIGSVWLIRMGRLIVVFSESIQRGVWSGFNTADLRSLILWAK